VRVRPRAALLPWHVLSRVLGRPARPTRRRMCLRPIPSSHQAGRGSRDARR
jgi:hypothetical protein